MKLAKSKNSFGYIAAVSISLVALALVIFAPAALLTINYSQWLFLIVACAICIVPSKKIQITEHLPQVKNTHWFPWLGRIIIFEILAIVLFASMSIALNIWQPAMGQAQDLPLLFNGYHLSISHGFFPWCMIALVCIAMRMHNDRGEQATTLIDCCPEVIRRFDKNQHVSSVINNCVQKSGLLTLVLGLSCVSLLFAKWLLSASDIPLSSNNGLVGLVLFMLGMYAMLSKKVSNKFIAALNNNIPPLLFLLAATILTACIIYPISASISINGGAISNSNDTTTQWILRSGWTPFWALFQNYWWLGLASLAGPYFANLSAGKTYKQMVAGILILPLTISIILPLFPDYPKLQSVINHNFSIGSLSILAAVSLFGILIMLFSKINRSTLLFTSLSKLSQDKPRSANNYVYQLFCYSFLMLGFICTTGILFPTFYILAYNFTLLLALIAIAINTLIKTLSNKPMCDGPKESLL
jgi:choline-glycine betaine transporter